MFEKNKYSLHWLKLWKKVFFVKWEEVVDLRGSGISFLFCFQKRKIFKKNLTDSLHKVEEITIGITGKLVKPNINISKVKFNNKFKGRKVICICPTANWTPKIWPEENFLKLIKKISMKSAFRDYIFVLIGPNSEKYKIKKLLSVKDKKIISMFGKFSLVEIFLFLKSANFSLVMTLHNAYGSTCQYKNCWFIWSK